MLQPGGHGGRAEWGLSWGKEVKSQGVSLGFLGGGSSLLRSSQCSQLLWDEDYLLWVDGLITLRTTLGITLASNQSLGTWEGIFSR